jgi:hypothetical protein
MADARFDAQLIEAAPRNFVVSTELGEGLALLDLRSNVYFSLSEVGTLVWDAIQEPTTRADLVRRITDVYDVGADECASDLDALLGELWDAKLIEVRPAAGA